MRRMKGTPIIIDENAVKAPAKRRWVPPAWWRPVRNGTAGLVAATVLIGIPTWLVKSGTGAEFVAMTSHQALEGSAGAGMRLTRIELDGNVHLSSDDLLTALEAREGDPILALDLAAARQRVQALPWVKRASVERQLPNAVVVRIAERDPIAIWQYQGRFMLVDREGFQIPADITQFPGLPQVVGDDAPEHAAKLIAMLGAEPDLSKRVKAAVLVSGRRWNIVLDHMDHGIELRLPEEDPENAWKRLADYDRRTGLLGRKVAMVDLRLADRLVIRTDPDPAAPVGGLPKRRADKGKDA